MSFFIVLNAVNSLLAEPGWSIHRCRRNRTDIPHFYVTNAHGQVLMSSLLQQERIGLTLEELILWLGQSTHPAIAQKARELYKEVVAA